MTCFIARAYGREAFMRSCALRILEAETISSARVTLRVFCTLLILVLISRPPAMVLLRLPGARRLEVFDALLERRFQRVVPVARRVDRVERLAQRVREVRMQGGFERTDLVDRHVVHVALVDRVDRQRLFGDRHRRVLPPPPQPGGALAAVELAAGCVLEGRGELRERRELTVL